MATKTIYISRKDVNPSMIYADGEPVLDWKEPNPNNYFHIGGMYCWLGLVNKQLGNKANAEEIIEIRTDKYGYEITYKESDKKVTLEQVKKLFTAEQEFLDFCYDNCIEA